MTGIQHTVYPARIIELMESVLPDEDVQNFYRSIGNRTLDELIKDINMEANANQVSLKKGRARELRIAVKVIREMRTAKYAEGGGYPTEVKM